MLSALVSVPVTPETVVPAGHSLVLWGVFNLIILAMLFVDLGIVNRKSHAVSLKEAAWWSIAWVCVSLLFCLWVGHEMGSQKSLEFLTGYLIEKSLSVDNLFVFILIFSYFHVSAHDQSIVLKWGILGALVMRLVLVLVGVTLLTMFHWVLYVFGGLLIFTGIRMATQQEQHIDPNKNRVVRLFRRFVPVATDAAVPPHRFFVTRNGRLHATPLFLTVLVVEASDLIFAIDSIPAVLAVSPDPFIVYTSNAFAILGLRALYFLLSGIMGMFRYLKIGVSIVLLYVGVKMLLTDVYHIPIAVSLGVILGVLTMAVIASLVPPKCPPTRPPHS